MKILLVSMNNLHFRRWTAQLENSGHDVYWFDLKDQGYIPSLSWVSQIVGWKKGFLKKRGRTFLKRYLPLLYKMLSNTYDATVEVAFLKTLQEIKPDVVHSFALYISCTPILSAMKVHNTVPWLYSSWGSDLYYYQNIPEYLKDIKRVLPRVTHLITDCQRDHTIARNYGFKGEHLGVFPGGGGFDLQAIGKWRYPIEGRTLILVKGYQGRSGRAVQVIKALEAIQSGLDAYKIVVFGAAPEVVSYCHQSVLPIEVHTLLDHEEVLKLMGAAQLYIGNSNSDGMPNTLLEAMCMGAFPIQSNPGGATAEIIKHGINGLLIDDCEDVIQISAQISKALESKTKFEEAFYHNQNFISNLDNDYIRKEVLQAYNKI